MEFIKKHKSTIIQIIFVIVVLACWQIFASRSSATSQLIFPPLSKIFAALGASFTSDAYNLLAMVGNSLLVIVEGLAIGIVLSFLFSGLSIISKTFYAIYNLLVSVFDLLPGVTILPLLILWVGVGTPTILILVIHSVIWPMSRSIMDGFRATPKLYIEAGRNMGLSSFELIFRVYIPAGFSYVLSGIKAGWARAWRGLLSAEMIFGATSTAGAGIGFFIQFKRTQGQYASLFAALIVIIVIGVIVEYGIFKVIEKNTIAKWGMTR